MILTGECSQCRTSRRCDKFCFERLQRHCEYQYVGYKLTKKRMFDAKNKPEMSTSKTTARGRSWEFLSGMNGKTKNAKGVRSLWWWVGEVGRNESASRHTASL